VGALARIPPCPRDPIDHPDIARMSLTELADLPLAPDCAMRNPIVALSKKSAKL
jgi:hypothetical protein